MIKKIPPSDLEWVRDALASRTMTRASIAKKLGISVSTLSRYIKQNNDLQATNSIASNVARALSLHASLSQQLHNVLHRLDKGEHEKGMPELIRLHAKSLLAVIAADQEITKAANGRQPCVSELKANENTGLDLAMARKEIYRRLARLRQEHRTDRDVPGEPE